MAYRFSSEAVLVLFVALTGCQSKPSVESTAPSAQPAAPAAPSGTMGMTIPEAELRQALNPKGEKPYSGPIGTVSGTIHVSGDAASEVPLTGFKPGKCEDGKAFYGKIFREGPGRTLGDVLVAVTEYRGFLPASGPVKTVTAQGCAFESRTIAMVFGQRLEVQNRGGEAVVPELKGAGQAALIVAMPGGDTVKLFPPRVGQYELVDAVHEFMRADVFVLKYPTVAVTGLDGRFEISGIPAGEVLVSAYLPALKKSVSQRVKVGAGDTATVDLTIAFDAKAQPPAPSPSAAISGK